MSKVAVEDGYLKPFTLLPAKPGTCPECAMKHDPEMPHNQQSLYYQYHFYNTHGRWPTWDDAMSHCTEDVRKMWIEALEATLAERGENDGN